MHKSLPKVLKVLTFGKGSQKIPKDPKLELELNPNMLVRDVERMSTGPLYDEGCPDVEKPLSWTCRFRPGGSPAAGDS